MEDLSVMGAGMGSLDAYQMKEARAMTLGGPRNPPVRKVVEAQIIEFKRLIKEREDFIASLDANPGIEDVLDKMRKLHL